MHTSAVRPRPRRVNRPSPPLSASTSATKLEPPRPVYPWATPRAATLDDAEPTAAEVSGERRRQARVLAVMIALGVAIAVLLVLVLSVASEAPARLP